MKAHNPWSASSCIAYISYPSLENRSDYIAVPFCSFVTSTLTALTVHYTVVVSDLALAEARLEVILFLYKPLCCSYTNVV